MSLCLRAFFLRGSPIQRVVLTCIEVMAHKYEPSDKKKRTCTTCINWFIESFASGHPKGLTHIGDTVQQYHLLYRSEDHDKAVLVSFVSSRVTVCSITFGTRSQHGILWQSSPSQFPINVFQPSSNQVQVNSQSGPKARLR